MRGATKDVDVLEPADAGTTSVAGKSMTHIMALPRGTELVGDFRVERVLGVGGFGITYLADEIALSRAVTIKEYFPTDFAARSGGQSAVPVSSDSTADYQWGLDRFIEEAKTLARFDHRNICRVYRYFRANNTGYMVLQFEEGASLKDWLKGLRRAPRQSEIDNLVAPLLDALEVIHKADFLHRDIAPDNVMVRQDGSPVLIDFGSARGEIARHARTISALVKPGYSPFEQYAEKGSQQGPWTDIYAFAATIYHAITGKRPPDSPSRMLKDEYVSAKAAALSSFRPKFLAAIDRALKLEIAGRPQSIAEWRGELLAPEPKPARKPRAEATSKSPKLQQPVGVAASAGTNEVLPPPDAPGQQGGILDFFEGLKKKAAADPAAELQLNAPPPPPSVQPVSLATVRHASAKIPLPIKPTRSVLPPPVRIEIAALPRPRPMAQGAGGRWRRSLMILLVGAGIASASLGLRGGAPNEVRRLLTPTTTGSLRPMLEAVATLDIKGHVGGTIGLGFAGEQFITAGADNTVKVWSATGGLVRTIYIPGSPITAMASLARRVSVAQNDGTVTLWDLDRGDRLTTFKRNAANIWAVAFAGSVDRIVAASHDWSVAVWDASAPAVPVQLLEGHDSAVQAVAFSAPKNYIASGGADRQVKLWSLDSGSLIRTYRRQNDFITAIDFSGDGRLMASGSLDGSIRIWSTASSRLVATLQGNIGRVNGLAFAPSGETLASVGDDGSLRLWDARRGRALRVFASAASSASNGGLKSVAFSANGRRLASGGEISDIKIRDIEPIASASRAGRE